MKRDLFFLLLGLLIGLIAGLAFYPYKAGATYKPEFASHSPRLKIWFQEAKLTAEAKKRVGWIYCCEQSERVRPHYLINKKDGLDEWSYLCDGSKDLEAACVGREVGSYKPIPHDVVHQEEITVPKGFENDPKVAEEFRQLRAEGVLFIFNGMETCFWPPESGQ